MYPVELPENNPEMFEKFKKTNSEMQDFIVDLYVPKPPEKCRNCIYNDFCDRPLVPKAYNGGF